MSSGWIWVIWEFRATMGLHRKRVTIDQLMGGCQSQVGLGGCPRVAVLEGFIGRIFVREGTEKGYNRGPYFLSHGSWVGHRRPRFSPGCTPVDGGCRGWPMIGWVGGGDEEGGDRVRVSPRFSKKGKKREKKKRESVCSLSPLYYSFSLSFVAL